MSGMREYDAMMQCQWILRILDFFAVSMVIPTMPQFLVSAGGTAQDYYTVLVVTTGVQFLTTILVGIAVDKTGRPGVLYIPLCLLSIVGAGLYAAADCFTILRDPRIIMVARMLTGAGTGKTTLVFVVLARIAKTDSDRNRWMVSLSTARSLGLFAGPALAMALALLVGASSDDNGGSMFGNFALPGVFLCVTNAVALIWLMASWQPIPPVPGTTSGKLLRRLSTNAASRPDAKRTLTQFFSQFHVLTTALTYCLGVGSAAALEYLVPIVTSRVLLWENGSGVVLMCISVVVLANQLYLMRLQRQTNEEGQPVVVDSCLLVVGVAGLAFTLLLGVVLWTVFIGYGAEAPTLARARWLLVVVPFVLSEAWFPYLGNGVNMTFTRLVVTNIPERIGVCQAIVNTNGPILGQMILTQWFSYSYTAEQIQTEGAPQLAIGGIGIINCLLFLCVVFSYGRLKPSPCEAEPSTPASSVTSLIRRRSSYSSDCILPIESSDSESLLDNEQ